jgi:hypothetical protein
MSKTIDENFIDWESHVFGFGYGTGERHTLGALKGFFGAIGDERGSHTYNYETIERALGPIVTWLLINALCKADIIEYGTSPRYGWLTDEGKELQAYLARHTLDELVELCNCGPKGYEEGRRCPNPFWKSRS